MISQLQKLQQQHETGAIEANYLKQKAQQMMQQKVDSYSKGVKGQQQQQHAAADAYRPMQQFQRSQFPTLPNRKFIQISPSQYNDQRRRIRLVSFNVMAKNADFKNRMLRTDALRGYRTRPNYYSWKTRGPLLIEEIKTKSPDIICLQGVDQFDYFQQKLAPRGFVGCYEKRTQPQMVRSMYFGDGLAIFWRTDKFELVGRQKCVLGDARYVSNIALLARLKRRSLFLNPNNLAAIKRNIIFETLLQFEKSEIWCVLSTKYLYLFATKPQNGIYKDMVRYIDLDLYERVVEGEDSFELLPKCKKDKKLTKLVFFSSDNGSVDLSLWVEHIKTAQIGIEIDVWNSHLIDGHSVKTEYRRVKQCKILFELIAKASVKSSLPNKNIGEGNPYSDDYSIASSTNTAKYDLDEKEEEYDDEEDGNDLEDEDGYDLSEKFKKMMETRIQKQQIVPVIIDPNKKREEDDFKAPEVILPKVASVKSLSNGMGKEESVTMSKKSEDEPFVVPTKLHRPLILCVDSESNAWGDAKFRIPPLCYTYLTMRSRNTMKNELYAHSTNQLMADPTMSMERHQWILQSAYALGFNAEPEVTAFNRYWPHEITEDHSVRNNIFAQRKKLDFSQSIEIAKCSDFILFSPQNFRVLQLLEPLKKEWIYSKWNRTLPNVDYPSDHIMIGVQFELADSMNAKATPIQQTPPASSAYSANTLSPSSHRGAVPNVNLSGNGPSISMSTLPTAQNRQYTPTPMTGQPFNNQQHQFANQNAHFQGM